MNHHLSYTGQVSTFNIPDLLRPRRHWIERREGSYLCDKSALEASNSRRLLSASRIRRCTSKFGGDQTAMPPNANKHLGRGDLVKAAPKPNLLSTQIPTQNSAQLSTRIPNQNPAQFAAQLHSQLSTRFPGQNPKTTQIFRKTPLGNPSSNMLQDLDNLRNQKVNIQKRTAEEDPDIENPSRQAKKARVGDKEGDSDPSCPLYCSFKQAMIQVMASINVFKIAIIYLLGSAQWFITKTWTYLRWFNRKETATLSQLSQGSFSSSIR